MCTFAVYKNKDKNINKIKIKIPIKIRNYYSAAVIFYYLIRFPIIRLKAGEEHKDMIFKYNHPDIATSPHRRMATWPSPQPSLSMSP